MFRLKKNRFICWYNRLARGKEKQSTDIGYVRVGECDLSVGKPERFSNAWAMTPIRAPIKGNCGPEEAQASDRGVSVCLPTYLSRYSR